MAWAVHTATALATVEPACHLDGAAYMEIEDVVPILRSLEVSHRACDTQDVDLIRGARAWRRS